MKQILALFKLEFKLNYRYEKGTIKKNLLSYILFLITAVVIFAVAFFAINMLSAYADEKTIIGVLSFLLTIIQLILFIYSISKQINLIYGNSDKILLARLPVSPAQIYLSKILVCFSNVFILNIALSLPTLIMFAILNHMTVGFYFLILIALIFNGLIPFALSLLISIPVLYLKALLDGKNFINLILSIITIIVGFIIYSSIIFAVADFILDESSSLSGSMIEKMIIFFQSDFIPSTWLSNVLLINQPLLFFTILFFTSIALIALFTFIGAKIHNNIFLKGLQAKYWAKIIKTKNKTHSPFVNLIYKEVKDIFRSGSYSFTYFGIAIATPIMVFICNKFVTDMAKDMIGPAIVFGISLLVTLIFMGMIGSTSASFISREGEQFWITKVNPHGIKIGLMAKTVVCFAISFFALFSSFLVLTIFKFIPASQTFFIFFIGLLFSAGTIFTGLNINLAKPNLFKKNKGVNSNLILTMMIGTVFAILCGILAIILSFELSLGAIMGIVAGITILFTAVNVTLFFTLSKKLYLKIEG